jgi:hypothetical protein
MDYEEVSEKIRKFLLEKAGLDSRDAYFFVKRLESELLDECLGLGKGDDVDDAPSDDEFDDEVPVELPELKKSKPVIKKPKVSVRG